MHSNFSILGSVRAVIQRVSEASVRVDSETIGSIGQGLMVLIAAGQEDDDKDAKLLAEKIANLRIFTDAEDKMNLSVLDIEGEVLGISQFTLFGDARKGRRPSFVAAREPVEAARLYEGVLAQLRAIGVSKVANGRFGADMKVALVNDGPVTILVDTKKSF
jgi:D-tyrosyl-tRNA(Tyr) deacylase